MPGFKAVEYDKKGDGKKCWKGTKIRCEFDKNKYIAEGYDKYWPVETFTSRLGVYGNAPFCPSESDACLVWVNNRIPIGTSNVGTGSGCMTGQKFVTLTPESEEEKELVNKAIKECIKTQGMVEQKKGNIAKAIGSGFEMVTSFFS